MLQQQARAEQAAQASLAVRQEERSAKLEAARRAEEKERRALRATQVAHPASVAGSTYRRDDFTQGYDISDEQRQMC